MSQRPKYQTLAETLRQRVAEGAYPPGARLDTENELARNHGMSRQTVRQALDVLEAEGLITRRRGSGTYVEAPSPRRRTMRVGVVTTYITEYIFPAILRGIETALSAGGCAMELAATQNRVDNERRILLEYLDKPVDGLIVEGTKTALPNPNLGLYQTLTARDTPVVFINGYYRDLPGCLYVVTDDRQGGGDAVRFLLDRGHTRIAGIFKSDDMQGLERYAGFMEGLLEAGLQPRDDAVTWFTTESRDILTLGAGGDALLESLKGYTAAVCYNDIVAARLYEALRRAGRRMPEHFALVSFDNSNLCEALGIPSLHHPKEAMGRVAVEKLLAMVKGGKETPAVLPWAPAGAIRNSP